MSNCTVAQKRHSLELLARYITALISQAIIITRTTHPSQIKMSNYRTNAILIQLYKIDVTQNSISFITLNITIFLLDFVKLNNVLKK